MTLDPVPPASIRPNGRTACDLGHWPAAAGAATRLDVTINGDGKARLSQLTARDARAVVSGSGLIQVTATTSLDAAVPGSGTIIYRGNPPQVTTSVTGSGTVTRR